LHALVTQDSVPRESGQPHSSRAFTPRLAGWLHRQPVGRLRRRALASLHLPRCVAAAEIGEPGRSAERACIASRGGARTGTTGEGCGPWRLHGDAAAAAEAAALLVAVLGLGRHLPGWSVSERASAGGRAGRVSCVQRTRATELAMLYSVRRRPVQPHPPSPSHTRTLLSSSGSPMGFASPPLRLREPAGEPSASGQGVVSGGRGGGP
jgi:hypothetical protein